MKGGKKKSSASTDGTNSVKPPEPPQLPPETTLLADVAAVMRQEQHHHDQQEQGVKAADKTDNGRDGEEDVDGDENSDGEFHEENEDGEADGEREGERPKLAEGYYEIEAVRKKRLRKGQVQYLIKWRGWPETANTWEPFKNLMSCSDVIDAFEESLRAGNHRSTRRKKRKLGSTQSQIKKKQRSPAGVTHNVPAVKARMIDESLSFPPINDPTITNHVERNVIVNQIETAKQVQGNSMKRVGMVKQANENAVKHLETAKQLHKNGVTCDFVNRADKKEKSELDTRGAMATKEVRVMKGGVNRQDTQIEANGLPKRLPQLDVVEAVQTGRRTGAKKRKSGSVKRFKQDLFRDHMDLQVGNINLRGSDLGPKDKDEELRSSAPITEILKPLCYSPATTADGHPYITFAAKRSDGRETMVDNRELRVNQPEVLIQFYEKSLRFSPGQGAGA